MWKEPYLETCCRSALHRLYLAGAEGRPGDLPDGACLRRMAEMDLCRRGPDGRFTLTPEGDHRHQTEITAKARAR